MMRPQSVLYSTFTCSFTYTTTSLVRFGKLDSVHHAYYIYIYIFHKTEDFVQTTTTTNSAFREYLVANSRKRHAALA